MVLQDESGSTGALHWPNGKPLAVIMQDHTCRLHYVLPFAAQKYLDLGWTITELVYPKEKQHDRDNSSEADT